MNQRRLRIIKASSVGITAAAVMLVAACTSQSGTSGPSATHSAAPEQAPVPANLSVLAVGGGGFERRSSDSGKTWQDSHAPSSGNYLTGVAATNGAAISVGEQGTVLRSLDRGASWSPVPVETKNDLNAVAGTGSTVVAVGAAGTILTSVDGGSTWKPGDVPKTSCPGIVFTGPCDLTGIAVTGNTWVASGYGDTILRSSDGGRTWNVVNGGTSSRNSAPANSGSALYVAASGSTFTAVGSQRILRSTDSGATWSPVPPQGVFYPHGIASASDGSFVAVGSINLAPYVWRSSDGGQKWSAIAVANPLPQGDVELGGVTASPAGGVMFASGSGGLVLRSADNGASWQEVAAFGADSSFLGAIIAVQ